MTWDALAPYPLFFRGAPAVIHLPHFAHGPDDAWLYLIVGLSVALLAMAIDDFGFSPLDRERKRLEKWLRKTEPDAEIFFTPKGQADKLKEYGWERVPFTWRGQEIWIKREPKSD